jgi:RHS repeat-associated protein
MGCLQLTYREEESSPLKVSWNRNGEENPCTGVEKYLYNGKELQSELGLDWYDYGARMYDAAIGRWQVMDPASESYYSLTPYHYVRNNPLTLYDINGMYDQALLDQWEREDLEQNGFNTGAVSGNNKNQYSGNIIANIMESPTTKNAYVGSDWDSADQNDMDGKYPNKDGKMIDVNGFEALYLFLKLYKMASGRLNNLVVLAHGNTSDWKGDGYYDYGVFVGNGTLTSSRLNLETNEGILMSRIGKLMNNDGNILFTSCYAGWTHNEMKSLMNDSGVRSINIYMNKDFSRATGAGRIPNFEDHTVSFRSYHIEFGKWLTSDKRHKHGWINAMTGKSYSNAMVTSSGKIVTKDW